MGRDSLIKIKSKTHRKLLDLRAVEYRMKERSFDTAWELATLEQRTAFSTVSDLESYTLWLNDIIKNSDIDTMGTLQLRDKAAALFIYNYSRLSLDNLRKEIKRRL